jgi:hypothetical protein
MRRSRFSEAQIRAELKDHFDDLLNLEGLAHSAPTMPTVVAWILLMLLPKVHADSALTPP